MGELNFNIFNIIIILGIIQGIIFGLAVLYNKKYKSKTNSFIALTVLVLSFSNLQYWIMDVNIKSIFEELRIPVDVLIVPAFFLYVNSYLQNKNGNRLITFLTIPFFISFIFHLILYFKLFFSINSFRLINISLESISFLFNIVLIIVIIIKINKYEKSNKVYDKIKVETKWLKQILYIGGAICLFWFAEIIYMQSVYNKGGLSIYYPLWISISFLVYWISYVGIINSKINKDREMIRVKNIKSVTQYKRNTLNEKPSDTLFNEVLYWIKGNKAYLNPNLSLIMVSKEFNISSGYLSQLFSVHSELNFNDFINELRIKESKKMLKDKMFNNYIISAIGLESGFNSKSSFYTAFKKFTDKTPNEYKKEVQNM